MKTIRHFVVIILFVRIVAIATCGLFLQTQWRGLSVCVSVCLFVTSTISAKTAEQIDMRFEG